MSVKRLQAAYTTTVALERHLDALADDPRVKSNFNGANNDLLSIRQELHHHLVQVGIRARFYSGDAQPTFETISPDDDPDEDEE